jgi:universal stress protein E
MTNATPSAARLQGRRLPKKILAVCTPGDEDGETLRAAEQLARAWHSEVSVLVVTEEPAEIASIARLTRVSPAEIEGRLASEHRERIRACLARATPGFEPSIHVRFGKPFIEIILHVLENDIELVVKRAEPPRGIQRLLFASMDQHLLRKCPCPVWLRLRNSPHSLSTIVVAVDVDEELASEPETARRLNRAIMNAAVAMASVNQATVHVLHVWNAPGEGLVRMLSGAPDGNEAAEQYVEQVQARHWRALDRFLSSEKERIGPDRLDGVELLPHLERGEPGEVIAGQARALGADLLVMGTVARTGVPGLIIGNTAEDTLNTTDCSVMTVKPPNYVSPVRAP